MAVKKKKNKAEQRNVKKVQSGTPSLSTTPTQSATATTSKVGVSPESETAMESKSKSVGYIDAQDQSDSKQIIDTSSLSAVGATNNLTSSPSYSAMDEKNKNVSYRNIKDQTPSKQIIATPSQSKAANVSKSAHSNTALEEKHIKNVSYNNITDKSLPASKTDQLIPTRGSELLNWVRDHMSLSSISDDSLLSDEEEEEVTHGVVKEKKKRSADHPKKEDKILTKKHSKHAHEVPVVIGRPSDMADNITLLIKKRKEEKAAAEQKARLESKMSAKSSRDEEPKEGKDSIDQSKPKKKKKKAKSATKIVKSAAEDPVKMAQLLMKQKEEAEEERKLLETDEKLKEINQTRRLKGLRLTLDVLKSLINYNKQVESKNRKDDYWRLYVECDNQPIINHIADVSSYISIWENSMLDTTPQEASDRTKHALKMLGVLDDFIENKPSKSERSLENYKWLRTIIRQKLDEMLEAMTYKILRDVTKNMNHVSLKVGDFDYKDDRFVLCLWLLFQLPRPLFNARKPPPQPISLFFKELQMHMNFPPSIKGQAMVVRVLYVIYDHLSDSSKSLQKPPKPKYYEFNLYDVMEKEWRVKKRYKVIARYRALYELELQRYENSLAEKLEVPKFSLSGALSTDVPPPKKFQLPEVDIDGVIPEVPFMKVEPTAEEYAETSEELQLNEMRTDLEYIPEQYEINLRKYIILGGVYMVNLFYQPPQPQHLVTMNLTVATFILPKKLSDVTFHEEYTPMAPSDEQKSPEALEAALKLQEEGFTKLISITLTFPKHVMYLELPLVCLWETETKIWSTKDIQDVKHNEEKGTVSFRTGRFGIFGLATFRYGNLPYQTWELKPDEEDNIVFQLTAAILMFEFKVKGHSITVTQFQNGPNDALQDIVSKTFSLTKLSRVLREGGVDIFPDYDAFCYVEGNCEKHWPTEHMCYYNMAQLSICYNFAWSRWNATEGTRSIIMQMRVYNPELQNQKPYNLALVTPLSAAYINCTEVTPIFCSDPVEGSKFCCNLWYLNKATSTVFTRNKLPIISQETVYTVAQLLIGTRILSFS